MNQEKPILTIEKLSKTYLGSEQPALEDISFKLYPGEVICLVGPSGSGKTSLLRCLVGLEAIDRGRVTLGKVTIVGPTQSSTTETLRQSGTYVFQDFNLWPDKTVLENIILSLILIQKIPRGKAIELARTLLRKFDLLDKQGAYPDFLSGGQKQRVAIIRALAVKPQILYLDEITSALDPELVSSVLGVIKILAKEGQSMILATHHLKFASEVADKIIFLEAGRIVQQASARDFLYSQKNPRINEFIKTLSVTKNEINVYEGYDQFQAFQLGTLKRFKKHAVKHVLGSSGDRWFEAMGDYYHQYEKERIERQIIWKMLMYKESPLDRDQRLRYPDLNTYRIIPKNLEQPANYYVIEDVVVIQIFSENDEPAVIEIKNADVAASYLNYFNLLWDQGKDPK